MSYRSRSLVLSILFLTLIHVGANAQKKIQLRLDLPAGSEHTLITEVENKQFADSALTELTSGILIHLEANIKVLEKSQSGVHTIENTFTRITAKQAAEDKEFYYDTDLEKQEKSMFAEAMAQEFTEMIGFPVVLKLDSRGEIVDKPDSLTSREAKAVSYFENYFITFPEEKISEGYTWQVMEEGQKMDGMDITLNYSVQELSKNMVRIAVKAGSNDLNLDEEKSALFEQFDLDMEGEMEIDPKTGKTMSQQLDQTIHAKAMVMEMHMVNSIRTWFEE